MLWLAWSEYLEWHLVQGSETGLPHQLMSGNIPHLASDRVVLGLTLGVTLLLTAWLLHLAVERAERTGRLAYGQLGRLRVAIFLGFFVTWELALQTSLNRFQETYVPDPLAVWKANPKLAAQANAAGKGVAGVNRPPNQMGIFDQRHTGPKPAGIYRIAFMGDSQAISTDHLVYGGEKTYARIVEGEASRRGLTGPQGRVVQTINAGMSGHTSWQGLMLLRSDVLPLQPDLVVEAFGYHDGNRALSYDHEVLTDDPVVWRTRQILYRSRAFLLLRSLFLRRQAINNDNNSELARFQRVPPDRFSANLRAFQELGERHSFRLALLLEPLRDRAEWQRAAGQRQAALRFATEHRLPVIDAFARFARMPDPTRQEFFEDGIHLNPQGHRAVADLVVRNLVQAGYLVPRAPTAASARK